MSVDTATVAKIASLARLKLSEGELEAMVPELNSIIAWVEQLGEVDVTGIEPMTAVTPMRMKKREDVVTDGGQSAVIVGNAPETEDGFFLVPKVVE